MTKQQKFIPFGMNQINTANIRPKIAAEALEYYFNQHQQLKKSLEEMNFTIDQDSKICISFSGPASISVKASK